MFDVIKIIIWDALPDHRLGYVSGVASFTKATNFESTVVGCVYTVKWMSLETSDKIKQPISTQESSPTSSRKL